MFPRQRKACGIVVERRTGPLRCGVARFAGLRELRRNVVRVGRGLILRQMARRTSRPEPTELTADMATRAGRRGVLARERESRCVMVECRPCPLRRRVARLASLRKARVARILGCLIVRQVAGGTCGPQPAELPADMATRAGRGHVLPS